LFVIPPSLESLLFGGVDGYFEANALLIVDINTPARTLPNVKASPGGEAICLPAETGLVKLNKVVAKLDTLLINLCAET